MEKKATLKQWTVLSAGILGAFMAILDISITNASLTEIQGSLSASLSEGSWISTAYLVAEIMVIPIAGWLAGIFSVRRYLLFNSVLFLVFSCLCGMARSLETMIVFRFFQGLTGGILIPVAAMLVMTELPPFQRPVGLALFGVVATFAPSLGPTIGGWLTVNYGWEYVFYLNIFPGSILITVVVFALDRVPSQTWRLKEGDWWGILTMSVGLACLTVVLEEGQREDWFESREIVTLTVIAAVAFLIFSIIETKIAKRPIVNFRLMKNRNYSLALILSLALGLGLYGSVFILPLYLGQIQHYDALQIGEVIMWVGFPQLLILPLVPRLVRVIDARVLIGVGVGMFALSCYMNTNLTFLSAGDQFRFTQVIRAVGQPLIMTPLQAIAYSEIPLIEMGGATGLFNMLRNLGGSMGIGFLGTLLSQRYRFHFARIAETIPRVDTQMEAHLHALTQTFLSKGFTFDVAQKQALQVVQGTINREAYIMAFNDCFLFMAVALMAAAIGLLFVKKAAPPRGPIAEH